MKVLIVIFALVAIAAAEFRIQTRDDLLKYRGECVLELGVSDELVEKYKKWDFPEDEKTKCYIRCIFTKMGIFDDAHGHLVDNLVKQLGQGRDADETRTEIVACTDANTDGGDKCEWAYRGFKCFREKHLSLIQTSVAPAS